MNSQMQLHDKAAAVLNVPLSSVAGLPGLAVQNLPDLLYWKAVIPTGKEECRVTRRKDDD